MRLKLLSIILLFVLKITQSFSGGVPILVSMDVPQYINPGSEVEVNMIVERGDIEGFVKVEEFFPIGVTVQELESGGAEFSFVHNYLTYKWNEIPVQDIIKIKFKMFVPSTIEGRGKIEGRIYFNQNKKLTNIKFDDFNITFQKEDAEEETKKELETPQKVIVGLPTKTKSSIEKQPKTEQPISISAKRNFSVISATEVTVKIEIEQTALSGFLKYEDIVPMGFKAKSDDNAGSTFSFLDNKVKHLWSEVPKDNKFTFSYNILRDGNDSKKFVLEGSLQYLDKGETKKIELNDEVNFEFKTNEGTEKISISSATSSENISTRKSVVEPTKSKSVDSPVAKKMVQSLPKQLNTTTSQGIVYKVQVCATQSKSTSEKVSQEFNITEAIETELQDGWYKYTIGTFKRYAEAKAFRKTKSNISTSPFVAAYYDGKRVTVQEANMIKNQRLMNK